MTATTFHPEMRLQASVRGYDRPPNPQRRLILAAILGLHMLGAWWLAHLRSERATPAEVSPLFVSILGEKASPAPQPPAPAPQRSPTRPQDPPPVQPQLHEATPVLTPAVQAEPTPAAQAAAVSPATAPAAAATAAVAPANAEPANPAPPRNLPPSAVQYLVAPPLEYPRAARRLRQAGRTVVRVFIDEAGQPQAVQVSRSSGFALLDEAALAAVRKARFKPYTENGLPVAGWALIPLSFDLEN